LHPPCEPQRSLVTGTSVSAILVGPIEQRIV
jgi:hypothetical protein